MPSISELTIPSKRNVKGLTATIAELKSGELVRAVFSTPRYGVVSIEGRAHFSKTTNSFMIAGRALDANLKPDKSLQLLEVIDPQAALADDGVAALSDEEVAALPSGDPADVVPTLQHGDVIAARYFELAYGAFTVMGACVAAPGASLMLGTWFVSRDGVPASRLNHVDVVARAADGELRIPAAISSWGDESGSDEL
ncbi:hypothetical protein ASF79_16560 [Agreia sp. Leaf335]|uniref:hypothetical protein n=1 Tax=Agreia sp. Leaf335 TaxID=1736340 RepID=UPI0006FDB46D|nr:MULTISPECIES: hypothetical protein [Microbacteriaceae]KQR19258.1 hypothetical protein ASF79_16560 [Agreia sp. Leaf335]PPF64072.1 hypothetical protein C5E11_05015 [Clavibacter michiganensis]